MPVGAAIRTMAIPTIISQLINLLYGLVDTYFIGRTGNAYMIAATTVTFTIYMIDISFANLCGIGGGSHIARLAGQNDTGNAKKLAAFSVYLAIGVSLLYSLIILVFLDPMLRMLGASDATLGYARQYTIFVMIIGNTPTILSLTLAHLLRSAGYSKQASIGLSMGGVLNMIFDPLFMFVILPPGNEVIGAAVATLLGNTISCIYLFIIVKKVSDKAPLSVKFSDMKGIRKEDINGLFSVGVPSAILTGLFDLANIFLNALMAAHGDLQLAAIGIVMKAERLPNAINLGICQGMLPIIAYNFTSGNRERMRNVISTARIYGLIISVLCLIMFIICASPIVKIFMSTKAGNIQETTATITFGILFLHIRCLASPFQFLNYHTSFCMQAMGNGSGTFIHAVVREIVFYIPFMFLLDHLWGENGLASALIAGEAAGAAFALMILHMWLKKTKEKQGEI